MYDRGLFVIYCYALLCIVGVTIYSKSLSEDFCGQSQTMTFPKSQMNFDPIFFLLDIWIYFFIVGDVCYILIFVIMLCGFYHLYKISTEQVLLDKATTSLFYIRMRNFGPRLRSSKKINFLD